MDRPEIAKASLTMDAPASKVWDALLNPDAIRRYMFGATAVSDWKEGSPIVWKGEWNGRPYEDSGVILRLEPRRLLRYSHYSPLSGKPDVPENRHTVTVTLSEDRGRTLVRLTQDNNPTPEARRHSEENWRLMLERLREVVEGEAQPQPQPPP